MRSVSASHVAGGLVAVSACLYVCLSACLPASPPVSLFIYLSIRASIDRSIDLSVDLSVFFFFVLRGPQLLQEPVSYSGYNAIYAVLSDAYKF